jgi:hypothetical protein
MKKCLKAYRLLRRYWHPHELAASHNIWIVKPGQNSKGSGVYCVDSLDAVTNIASKMKSRIV